MPGRLVVIVQEQSQAVLVHRVDLRERQRLAHEPRLSLPQNVVAVLDMVGLSLAIARRSMLLLGQHFLVSFPEVRVQKSVYGRPPW